VLCGGTRLVKHASCRHWSCALLCGQAFADDTAKLKEAVREAGGLERLQDQKTLRTAMQGIDPLLSEACGAFSHIRRCSLRDDGLGASATDLVVQLTIVCMRRLHLSCLRNL